MTLSSLISFVNIFLALRLWKLGLQKLPLHFASGIADSNSFSLSDTGKWLDNMADSKNKDLKLFLKKKIFKCPKYWKTSWNLCLVFPRSAWFSIDYPYFNIYVYLRFKNKNTFSKNSFKIYMSILITWKVGGIWVCFVSFYS